MLKTGIRQFRMAWSIAVKKPINGRNIELLIADARETLAEFGTPGDDFQQLLDGPLANPRALKDMQTYSLQATIRYLMRYSPFYQKLLAPLKIKPGTLTPEDLQRIPITCKADLQSRGSEFITIDAHPSIITRTTGTTGHPLEIWLSRYELELWSSITALGFLLRSQVTTADCIQINISSRAILALQMGLKVYQLIGARSSLVGLISPDESLDYLLADGDQAPTVLNAYPSYLAQLVLAARKRQLQAHDFHLRSINCGSEVLSSTLKLAAQETFGASINDIYSMTETAPVSAQVCSQGHLHHDINTGFTEVVSLSSNQAALPGELGTLVVTPYYPYRTCMPVLRYGTRDVVRCLSDEPLSCELAGLPATSNILGKADHLFSLHGQIITFRDLIEVIETIPSHPWPARFRARVVEDVILLELPAQTLAGLSEQDVIQRFHKVGIPVKLVVSSISVEALSLLRPLRSDLNEITFTTRKN